MNPLVAQRSRSRSWLRLLGLCASAAVIGGCATPATYQGMVPTSFDTAVKHPQTVAIAVNGGQETDAVGKPQISDAAFSQALVEAITRSQVFSRVVQANSAHYVLQVTLFGMEQPSFGFSFTVHMEAGWVLKRADNGRVVWQEAIKSEHTVSASESFAGVTRLRLATEGAARNNIAQGLAKISKLDL